MRTEHRILLVDDEHGLRTTLAANLELEGFEVHEAADASSAMRWLESNECDVVLSDVRMPGTSGVEFYLRLREANRTIPFVLMTAFSTENQVETAIHHGVFAVLPKPFAIENAVGTLLRAVRTPSVLVVDDDATSADAAASALESSGLRVEVAYDAEAALALAKTSAIDVVVTDIRMPDVDGLELARRLRAQDATVTVIVFSGFDVPELLSRATREGAFACLRKPFPVERLIDRIAHARAAVRA